MLRKNSHIHIKISNTWRGQEFCRGWDIIIKHWVYAWDHTQRQLCGMSSLPKVNVSNSLDNPTSVTFQRLIFQRREPMQKTSKIRMAIALAKINRGTLIQGLHSISRSSKSVAELLQPQLVCRLLELRDIAHHLLREVNAPKQPLYNVQVSEYCICTKYRAFL